MLTYMNWPEGVMPEATFMPFFHGESTFSAITSASVVSCVIAPKITQEIFKDTLIGLFLQS